MRIYVGITAIQFGLLLFTHIGVWDALLQALGTIPTGGFSNHSESVAFFANVGVEVIITVFMFLCGFNFALYDTLLRVGPRPFWRRVMGSSEAKAYTGIAVGATLVVALVLWLDGGSNGNTLDYPSAAGWKDYRHFWTCVRDASFQVVSMQTSTGFGTANFDLWPQATRVLLMLLAIVGACAGSTGGGLKVVRMMIVGKAAIVAVRHFVRPRAIHSVRMDGVSLDDGVVASITGYFALWMLVFSGGTFLISCFEIDLVTSGTAVLATLNNIGPGLRSVGPYGNFSEMPMLVKLVLTIFMILGRLEFYAVVALFVPGFWKR
jgi:trk system potassium uptake protein TrkH